MIRSASLFSQVLREIPREEFERLAAERGAERNAKGFTCWTQFVAMLFCQFSGADSLRTICAGLSCCLGKLVHLGVGKAPNKSTLSYANAHRPAELYEDVFWSALSRFRSLGRLGARKHEFRFKNKLLSLDATVISLCLSLYPWAEFRRAKGGLKVHLLLDHDDYMPSFARLTEGRLHEVNVARTLRLNPGSIVAMDRAYNDYSLFAAWSERGIFFVTRLKSNADYETVQSMRVPQNRNILSDEIIRFTGLQAERNCPHLLRKVAVWDEENQREIVLLTNHLEFGATTISAIYKDRWKIEVFFKTLKQNLKVKSFVGTSENAILIQIWTAMIALLIFKWLHHVSKAGWSLSTMAEMLKMNLFTYRDLLQWLHNPFDTPPIAPESFQLSLPLR